MTLTLRPLQQGDRPRWAELWQGYLEFYETSLPAEVYDATFAALLSDAPHSPSCLLAEHEGRIIGLVHFLFHAHCWRPEGICYLQDLFVSPEARACGAGRALIEAVYKAADVRGVPGVYWLTQDFNTTARQLYDRVGQCTPFIKYVRPS